VIPNLVNEIKQLVESNYQVILTGAPGTGKTYTARKVLLKISVQQHLKVVIVLQI
jgi:transcriptional regulator with AAA-type ATPase domain